LWGAWRHCAGAISRGGGYGGGAGLGVGGEQSEELQQPAAAPLAARQVGFGLASGRSGCGDPATTEERREIKFPQ